jgi:pimeloyl-ACP methyl ester carboxylesterase
VVFRRNLLLFPLLLSSCLDLQLTRRPYRIILHGESIGGMVACHVARTHPVDALVCDRTFATLDSTAARLLVRLSIHFRTALYIIYFLAPPRPISRASGLAWDSSTARCGPRMSCGTFLPAPVPRSFCR